MDDVEELRHMFQERAAMLEYDGGFPRHRAEILAYWDTFLRFVTLRYPEVRAEFDAIIDRPKPD